MPLLCKKPFVQNAIPSNLLPTDKVFYCEQTNEVFTNYDDFWQRLVLLNALVWSCELTGKGNLTYAEAIESEEKAKLNVSTVPNAIRMPLLYAANLTKRTKVADMNEDVFGYIRERYFVGEEVEAIISRHWYDCKVTRIIMPTEQEIRDFQKEWADEEVKPDTVSVDEEISVIRDDHHPQDSSSLVNGVKKEADNEEYPPYGAVTYEVIEIEPFDYKVCKKHIVKWEQIRRLKASLTKDKCKIFLKQHVCLGDSFLVVKDSELEKYDIRNLKYSDIFVGKPPVFEVSKPRKSAASPSTKKVTKKTEDKVKSEKSESKPKKPNLGPTSTEHNKFVDKKKDAKINKEKLKEELKVQMYNQKIERRKMKQYEKEEKRLKRLFMAQYNEPREDLLCDDHKELPQCTPIQCRIPSEYFGDFMMMLQFINGFSDVLELKDVYPNGVTFDMLEHAMVEKEVAGILNDLIQLLIGAIFSLQKEEEEEIQEASAVKREILELNMQLESKSLKAAVNLANEAVHWIPQSHNISLQNAHIDALTVTELVRVHLLASGATDNTNACWRMMNRGGFRSSDDPGLHFKIDEPLILQKLSTGTIFELDMDEKLKIFSTLMCQILTFASVRDIIDEKIQQFRDIQLELRLLKMAEIKKEKEDILLQKQKNKDEKLKLLEKKKVTEANGTVNGTVKEVSEVEVEETQEEIQLRKEKELEKKEKRKLDFEKKILTFLEKLISSKHDFHQLPMGEDRLYRKYWLFTSLPAFVVEDYDANPGKCIDTPVKSTSISIENSQLHESIKTQAIKNVDSIFKEEKNASDKENDMESSFPHKSEVTNVLQENANGISPIDEAMEEKASREISDSTFVNNLFSKLSDTKQDINPVFGLCSANPASCEVHSSHNRPRWLLFKKVEEFHNLINCLNPRGEREGQLRDKLIEYKHIIEKAIKDSPVYKLDPTMEPQEGLSERKVTRGQPAIGGPSANLNFPPETPVQEIFEYTLRDMIVEFEENLNSGMLGALKVGDRSQFHQAIVDKTPLPLVFYEELDFGGRKRLDKIREEIGLEPKRHTYKPDAEISYFESLKIAIVLLGQAVEAKYLKTPLAESDKAQKRRLKAETRLRKLHKKEVKEDSSSSDDEIDCRKMSISDHHLRLPLERWEKSLMSSTSLSQLSLHLATLDNSVIWSKSVLKTCCSKCRKKSDPELMLLCDECNRGFHMYCLVPKLKCVPEGDWFCDRCKPKEKPKSPRKQRKMYCEISEDEDEEDQEYVEEMESEVNHEYCDACELSGELILCDTCPRSFHLDCADLRKVPRGDWFCPFCKEENSVSHRKKEDKRPERRSGRQGSKRSRDELEEDDEEYHKSKIEALLTKLTSLNDSVYFRAPLLKSENPDYYDIIRKPIDFRTIRGRFNNGKYSSDAEIIADILLLFQNSQQYYQEKSKEYKASVSLYKAFTKMVDRFDLDSAGHLPPAKRRK